MKNWLFLIVFVLMVVTACETVVINRGYVMETADFSKITAGKDDARKVFELFGSPTMRSTISGDHGEYSWYYVSKKMEKKGFLDPKVVDYKTVVVTFKSGGIVKSVSTSSYEKSVSIVKEKTRTEGKTSGFVGETFGGLGKYMNRYTDKGK